MDRAALDVALELGIPCGGWCPKGRKAEDGALPLRYPMRETPDEDYAQRTEWNVRDSDGTLVLNRGLLDGGTALTVELAQQHRKPCLVMDLERTPDAAVVRAWLGRRKIRTLNVAGPRESKNPGVYRGTAAFLRHVLTPPPHAPVAETSRP